MLSDELRTAPLLSEDDLRKVFESAWGCIEWQMPKKTKKNPNGLMSVNRLMYILESAVSVKLSVEARKAVTGRRN